MLQIGNVLKRFKLKNLLNSHFGGLAQLARAPALQAGGQRFESVILHSIVATLYKKTLQMIFDILDNTRFFRISNQAIEKSDEETSKF